MEHQLKRAKINNLKGQSCIGPLYAHTHIQTNTRSENRRLSNIRHYWMAGESQCIHMLQVTTPEQSFK